MVSPYILFYKALYYIVKPFPQVLMFWINVQHTDNAEHKPNDEF